MLNLKPACVLPIIKYLAAKYVPSDPPYRRISLVSQPLMTYELGVEVCDFKGAVVHDVTLAWRRSLEEDRVVIRKFRTKVNVQECENVEIWHIWVEENIGGREVEIVEVKREVFVEGARKVAIMTQLVDHCWPRLKALKLAFNMLVQYCMGDLW